jgi:hypothetical protein
MQILATVSQELAGECGRNHAGDKKPLIRQAGSAEAL